MHTRRLMLRRTINGIQNQRIRTSIDELMLRPSRHDDQIPSLDILIFTSNRSLASPGCEG